MKLAVRTFEVRPDAPADPPVQLEDREVVASTVDEARGQAEAIFRGERRTVRSLSMRADGGLIAYVLPPTPEPERETPVERPRRKRRPRRGRSG